ncbi:MAG: hypothetical protein NC226_09525 [Bacteroides cellulosilyticus]|nr:hypothetical protein [Bacteroides cellulosilyticus]
MTKTTTDAPKSPILPAKEYYTGLDKVHRSMVLAELALTTDKSKITIWRWFSGVSRPDRLYREQVAFTLGKIVKAELNGDELFPEDFPYKGPHTK